MTESGPDPDIVECRPPFYLRRHRARPVAGLGTHRILADAAPQCLAGGDHSLHAVDGADVERGDQRCVLARRQPDTGAGKLIGCMQALERAEKTRSVPLVKSRTIVAHEICSIAVRKLLTEFNFSLRAF